MTMNTGRRDPAKELFWRQHVTKHADSGLSVRNFCRQHELKEVAFYWWRRELTRRDAERDDAATVDRCDSDAGETSTRRCVINNDSDDERRALNGSAFVPVHITDDAANRDHGSIEIVLTCGRLVRVHSNVDQQALSNVLDVLERRAC